VSAAAVKIVITGGGVASLEALLALRRSLGGRAHVEVLAPEREFRCRELAVAEPFSLGEVARFDLTELIEDAGGTHRLDALREVRAAERVVSTPMWWPPTKVAGRYLAPYMGDHADRTNHYLLKREQWQRAIAAEHR
jgi:hypothetical protein